MHRSRSHSSRRLLQKGVNLIGQATLQGRQNHCAARNRRGLQQVILNYNHRPYADVAKQMLATIGAKVETNYGTKKPKKSN